MIDAYTLNPKHILSSDYTSVGDFQEVVVPTLLRDFSFISNRSDILDKTGVKIQIYVKSENYRINIVYQDKDYVGPTCFGCGKYGNVFFDQLQAEREQNISERYVSHFLIPFDPSVPLLTLDTTEHCFILKPPTEQQQIEIFAGYISRIRRL